MAMNFLQIRQDATARAGGNTTTVDTDYPMMKTWINQRYHDLNTKMKWKWNEAVYDFQTPSNGTQYVSLTAIDSNYREIRGLRLTDAAYAKELLIVNEAEIDRYYPRQTGSTQGTPQGAYIWAGRIYFWPIPDQAYNVEIRTWDYDPDLSNDTDVPNLPLEAQQILAEHGYSMILKSKYIFDQALAIDNDINARIERLVEEQLEKQAQTNDTVFMRERVYNL